MAKLYMPQHPLLSEVCHSYEDQQ